MSIVVSVMVLVLSSVMSFSPVFGTGPGTDVNGAHSFPTRGFAGGNGTLANPYQIADVLQLQNMSSDLLAHYVLINDIDATATKDWNTQLGFDPVGDESNPFKGTLDGQDHGISKLWIDRSEDRVGLFGVMRGAEVCRLSITDAEVRGNHYVGVLCGRVYDSRLWNCTASGECVSRGTISGGMVGEMRGQYSNMTRCSADVAVKPVSIPELHGGLIGAYYDGLVAFSHSMGDVEIAVNSWRIYQIGGLIGYNSGTVRNCSSKGSLLLTGGGTTDINRIGGLIGEDRGTVAGSCSVGKSASEEMVISVSGFDWAGTIGGLIGYELVTVIDSYSTAAIEIEASSDLGYAQSISGIGGLIGVCEWGGYGITNCYWAKRIEVIFSTDDGINLNSIGGLIGYNAQTISNCRSNGYMNLNGYGYNVGGLIGLNQGYLSGSVSGVDFIMNSMSSTYHFGGLVGYNGNRDVTSCIADGDLLIRKSSGGTMEFCNIGGLIGWNDYRRVITDCRSTGKVTVTGLPSGASRIGGLVGMNYYGTITRCRTTSQVSVEVLKAGGFQTAEIGGLVGYCLGPVDNSFSDGSVEVKGTCDPKAIGGMIGINRDTVRDCRSTATVNIAITSGGTGISAVGAMIGQNDKTVMQSHSSGRLTYDFIGGTSGTNNLVRTGGLVGFNLDGSYAYSCSYIGRIEPGRKGLVYVATSMGGLIGENSGVVDCCYSKGSISINESTSPSNIGGLVGMNSKDIMNSYSMEYLFYYAIPIGGQYIGGLVGYNKALLKNSYSVLVPDGVATFKIGGIAGKNDKDIVECFFDGDMFNGDAVAEGSSSGAYKNSTELMMERTTFVSKGWDFTEKWGIIVHMTYPYLFPLYQAPEIEMDQPEKVFEDEVYSVIYTITWSSYPEINSITETEFETNADWLSHVAGSKRISGTPDNLDIGFYWSNLSTEDRAGVMTFVNFTFEVINVNDPPKIVTEDLTEAMEDEYYSQYYYAVDEDPILTRLTWAMSTDAKWLFFEGNHLHGTPLNYDIGNYWVNVTVWDSERGSDYTNFTVSVGSANDPPAITIEAPPIAFEDEEYRINLTAIDVDQGDKLKWTLLTDHSWLLMARTYIFGTPGNDDVGAKMVILKVEDLEGATDELSFMLEVRNTNDPPTWLEFPVDQNITKGSMLTLDSLAVDQDAGDSVHYNISSTPPTNISIHPTAGTIRWTYAAPGNYTITVMADDGELSVSREFNVTVRSKPYKPPVIQENHAPVLDVVQDQKVEAGTTLVLQMTASDEDLDRLIFLLVDGPDGMVVSADGKLVWTPSIGDVGEHIIYVSVTDTNATVYDDFEVNVSYPAIVDDDDDDDDDDDTSGGGMSVPLIAALVALSLLCALLLLLLLLLLVMRRAKGGKGEGPEEGAEEGGEKEDEEGEVEEMEEVGEGGEAMDGVGADEEADSIVDDASDEALAPEDPEKSDID